MRLRFLAAAGPNCARERLSGCLLRRASRVIEQHDLGCLTLWVEPGTPLIKNERGNAVLIGSLFGRSSALRQTSLSESRISPNAFVREFWGTYVLLETANAAHWVLRDPSGSIPVYYGAADGLQLYASDADFLGLAWSRPFNPNLGAVRQWLRFPYLRTARTGALGVTELLPGMARECNPLSESSRQIWFPESFLAPNSNLLPFADAGRLLREEIQRCVPLLAADRPDVVLQLSGGLDSSILAAALANGGITFRALNFATHSPDGDERRYARQVAQKFGIELLELTEAELDFYPDDVVNPLHRPPDQLVRSLRRAQAARAGADALLLDGAGGDNIFASFNSTAPAIDAFQQCGIACGIRTLRDISAMHGCTLWEAAGAAFRRMRRNGTIRWAENSMFLEPSPDTDSSVPDTHPWLASLGSLAQGSADHLRMIVGIYHFLADPARDQPLNLHPLISQPIVELCLSIPSWLWVEGGRDRAVARAAFRNLLPENILNRRGKGSLQSMFVLSFLARRSELKDYLCSGRLAAEKIIDAGAVAAYLNQSQQPRDPRFMRILDIATTEQWLRSFG